MKLYVVTIRRFAGLPIPWQLAGPFDNWKDAEKAEAYLAMQGKVGLEIIEA